MLRTIKYYIERCYPYAVSLCVLLVLKKHMTIIVQDKNYSECLNGIVTLGTIIIGFLGAIMPVIVSIKSESKLVTYIFDKEKNKLFSKYLKATIVTGLVCIVLSLTMHLHESMGKCVLTIASSLWLFFSMAFMVTTYRSMSCMIKLLFLKKDNVVDKEKSKREKSAKELELQETYKE